MSNIDLDLKDPAQKSSDASESLGKSFLEALSTQDFDRIQDLFAPRIRFRALVPSGIREGSTSEEAIAWLKSWFGGAEVLQILQSATSQVFGRLYLSYRLRLYNPVNGWQGIEQHVYCDAQNESIVDMALMCSGFHKASESFDPETTVKPTQHSRADKFYDAGSRGCAEGPIDDIASLLHRMDSGQVLEIQATDPSVAKDIPAWCRLSGNEFLDQDGDRYFVRRK